MHDFTRAIFIWQLFNFNLQLEFLIRFQKLIIIVSQSVGLRHRTAFDTCLMHSNQIQIQFYEQNHIDDTCTPVWIPHITHTVLIKCCRLFFVFTATIRCSLPVVAWFSIVDFAMANHLYAQMHWRNNSDMYATEKHTKHKFPPVKIIIGNENNTNGCYMLRAKFQKGHWYVSPSIHALIHTIKLIKYV